MEELKVSLMKTRIKKTVLGASSELKAAAHFMKQGFHVSRALDPQCPFDLVLTNDKGECALIDVKTISRRKHRPKQSRNRPGDKINRCLSDKQKKMNIAIYDQEA